MGECAWLREDISIGIWKSEARSQSDCQTVAGRWVRNQGATCWRSWPALKALENRRLEEHIQVMCAIERVVRWTSIASPSYDDSPPFAFESYF